jgi:threonine synthase
MSARTTSPISPFLVELECTACGTSVAADGPRGTCGACGRPLAARYDLAAVARAVRREDLAGRVPSLWRYREVLPLAADHAPVTLGEGFTPLLPLPGLARGHDLGAVWVKDESTNPTGSFKARGLSAAVTMAHAFGARAACLPSAGNAGGALAAYAAAAGLAAHVFVPADCPRAFVTEATALGAVVTLVPGFITDAGRRMREVAAPGWADLSTLREPYRVEGKKTMGYELAEQLEWTLPDVILYPTGGGTGLVGMAKAFDELEELGWIASGRRPRMVCVQVEGCAPIVRAFEAGAREAVPWERPATLAAGIRVPAAIGDRWMLDVLRASGGTAVAVPEAEMLADTLALSRALGVLAAPEGGAVLAAFRRLVAAGWIRRGERVVLFNTGSGLKYLEAIEAALAAARA